MEYKQQYVRVLKEIKRKQQKQILSGPTMQKEPEVTPDIIGNRRNKRHKRELRRQRSRPLRAIKTVEGFEVLRTK